MKRRSTTKRVVMTLVAGSYLMQLGNCTTNDLQVQLANGARTTLNGLFNLATQNLVNNLFGVNN